MSKVTSAAVIANVKNVLIAAAPLTSGYFRAGSLTACVSNAKPSATRSMVIASALQIDVSSVRPRADCARTKRII